MRWLGYSVAFLAGAVVGGLVVRELAIARLEAPVTSLGNTLFGQGTYASGQVQQLWNNYLRSN